jgi:murein L,D-transpeptidase YcbB/YkuD
MSWNAKLPLIISLLCTIILPSDLKAQTLVEEVGAILRERIEEAGTPPKALIGKKLTHVSPMLPDYYTERGYWPAWIKNRGPTKQAYDLIETLNRAEEHGLLPDFYPSSLIKAELLEIGEALIEGKAVAPARLADIDLLLTDDFLTYSYDLLAGRVNPATIEGEWADTAWEADLPGLLKIALEQDIVEEALESVIPPHPGYFRLKQMLAEYRRIAESGGWPLVPEGPIMKAGSSGRRVELLRNRLQLSGDLEEDYTSDGGAFDEALEYALIRYQMRHGLVADGVVGPKTLMALNVSVEARIRQIKLNMERWRWLPESLGKRYIMVNIADFGLTVVEDSFTVMRMKIVVGKPYWHTPSFSARMTHMVLNPSWNVPRSIMVEEILPKLQRNPGYIPRQGFKVYRGWGSKTRAVDPHTINWSGITEQNLRYRLMQQPGPQNPLGRVKFMFPNRFKVYLHDTPSRALFANNVRTFSHGCIRIERPLELADYLLSEHPDWSYGNLLTVIDEGDTLSVNLPEPFMVHLLYWTAWIDDEGDVQFRNDVYGRDEALSMALFGEPLLHGYPALYDVSK